MTQSLAAPRSTSDASGSLQARHIAFSLQVLRDDSVVHVQIGVAKALTPRPASLCETHIVQSVLPLLDVVASASILTDDEGRVFAQNEVAAHLFARSEDLRLTQARMSLSDPKAAKQFHARLTAQRAVAMPLPTGDLINDRCDETLVETSSLRFHLLRRITWHHLTLLHLRIEDLDTQRWFQLEQLMAKGLTAAEGRIALALYRGASVAEHAANANIALSTARTHLQRAMGKLEVSRQIQLVILLGKLLRGDGD